jgi:hypothetical protein
MDREFRCKNQGRVNAVKNPKNAQGNSIAPTINGIDYLEVDPDNQKELKVYFLHNLPGQLTEPVPPAGSALEKENIRIEGGVRIKNISVKALSAADDVLTVTVDQAGDFSPYILRIVTSAGQDDAPDGFDSQLSAVEFSFKAGCPSEFDCKTEIECAPGKGDEPEIDYLAKDYAGFRRLMLDRLSILMPGWLERNPADLQVALVELLAYTGDYLSYYQDAAATEAYLGTARRRVSLRRHARLLDYFVHDGCNARTFVHFEIEEGGAAENQELESQTLVLTAGNDDTVIVPETQKDQALAEQPVVFETMHPLILHGSHNRISFYTWSDSDCCLPTGSTRATLKSDPELLLKVGDLLIFQEILGPNTGNAADADPLHRHAVRLKSVVEAEDKLTGTNVLEIQWYDEDALPFPLCLTAEVPDEDGVTGEQEVSVARGNVVLADYGRTIENQSLVPASAPEDEDYLPRLLHGHITFAVPYDHIAAVSRSAAETLLQEPSRALPAVTLVTGAGEDDWNPVRDLLASDRFDPHFVVEVERDLSAQLRFGDDVAGKKPASGFTPTAAYRIGSGRAGNVGAQTLRRVITEVAGIDAVTNPLPATGGQDGENMEQIRQFAPQAFRTLKRAVTETDYADVTQLHSQVQKATAAFRWTGSWHTVFINVDRKGGTDVDADFEDDIRRHLEQYRLAGYDLEINGPVYVPLEILIDVCVKSGYFQSHVKESLSKVFSRGEQVEGGLGFFHPDNFTFGQPLYLSALYQRAMEVDGVASVEAVRFQRWGKTDAQEKENGVLETKELEIIRLDNDLNFPENGKIDFRMHGGM